MSECESHKGRRAHGVYEIEHTHFKLARLSPGPGDECFVAAPVWCYSDVRPPRAGGRTGSSLHGTS
eukprot:1182561-Prorocentrum_minimum.AAC.1